MRAVLTDLIVKQAKPGTEIYDMACPTLAIRVGKTKKTWVRHDGKSRKAIGTYPSVSLQDARKRVSEPKSTKTTFKTLLDDFKRVYLPSIAPSTAKEWDRLLTKHFSHLTHIPTTREIYTKLETLKPSEANHATVPLKRMFRWAKQTGRIETYPDITKPNKERSRERVLTLEEIAKVWTTCSTNTPFHLIVRLLILTGQRRGEIANIHLCQISHQTNTKSANAVNTQNAFLPHSMVTTMAKDTKLEQSHVERIASTVTWPTTKNTKPHTIPLSNYSTHLVGQLTTLLTNYTSSYSAWSKPKAALDKASGVRAWCLHDIRRSCATHWAEQLKMPPHLIEAALNHTMKGVAGIYNRASYVEEIRPYLEAWEALVLSLPHPEA